MSFACAQWTNKHKHTQCSCMAHHSHRLQTLVFQCSTHAWWAFDRLEGKILVRDQVPMKDRVLNRASNLQTNMPLAMVVAVMVAQGLSDFRTAELPRPGEVLTERCPLYRHALDATKAGGNSLDSMRSYNAEPPAQNLCHDQIKAVRIEQGEAPTWVHSLRAQAHKRISKHETSTCTPHMRHACGLPSCRQSITCEHLQR